MASIRSLTIGGVGATPSLDDVVRIAGGQPVVLDTNACDRIKKASPPPKAFQAEPAPAPGSDDASAAAAGLLPRQARAVVATKLLSLVNGSSGVRLQVCQYLAELLNSGVVPRLPAVETDAGLLSALADACHGAGASAATGDASAPGDAPGLSAAERAVLEGGASGSAGVACLAVAAARQLLALAPAVAALSIEAAGAPVKPFDTAVINAQGYKSAAAVADELRTLLEGSKRAGRGKGTDAPGAAFAMLPQRLGAAVEAVAAAYQATRSEVTCEALPAAGQAQSSPVLPSALGALSKALVSVAQDSQARARHVMAQVPGLDAGAQISSVGAIVAAAQQRVLLCGMALLSLEPSQPAPGVTAALTAAEAVAAVTQALALEAAAALFALAASQASAAQPEAAEGAAEKAGKDKGKGGKDKDAALGKGTMVAQKLLTAAMGAAGFSDLEATRQGCLATLTPLEPACNNLIGGIREMLESNQARRKPKIAKGTRDYMPEQMAIREKAFSAITGVFKRHGAVTIDTPVFELRETLTGKYGEDSKLIYDLADQGGELLSLRYDLTVPFARFVAVHNTVNIKRYHIGKVYRRDQPQMNRGRFREFFQCDFDIAGAYPTMVADAEVIKVLVEILTDLQLGQFEVKLNHRGLLDAMLEVAGVPPEKFRAICSAIDKLDKAPWEEVRAEMVDEKGLPGDVADIIGTFVVLRGKPIELLEKLCEPSHALSQHKGSAAALEELRHLFGFLTAMGAVHAVVFDLSLARGLDYYTGVIYEAVMQGSNVGSIAAGGRYDTLVGMFSGKDVPSVGVSIGIERVFAIMEAQAQEAGAAPVRSTQTQVLVASIGNGMQAQRMELASTLWRAGIAAEFGFKANPKMGDSLGAAFDAGIPFMVLFGSTEIEAGVVKVKDIAAKTEDEVPLALLVEDLKRRLALPPSVAPPVAPAAPPA